MSETPESPTKKLNLATVGRVVSIIAVVGVLIAAIVASMNQHVPNTDKIWDEQMTMGNLDAENYFVIYSDIACPYCIAFENAVVEHEEEFQNYIEKNDILIEVRVSDFLYEYGQTNPISSRYSSQAIFCARDAGRFWDYYNLAVTTVWNDYFKIGGKNAYADMEKLPLSYWIDLGRSIGLGDDFAACVENGDNLDEIEEKALKSAKATGGLPYFKFNSYVSSGFSLEWGWQYVLMYLDNGLKSK